MLTVPAAEKEPGKYFKAGKHLLSGGDTWSAIRAFQRAIHLDPSLRAAYVYLARAFLQDGFLDNGIQHFVRAARLSPLEPEDQLLLQKAMRLRDQRTRELQRARIAVGARVVRFLGAGWEGAVYVVRAADGREVVLKAFHPAFIRLINYEGPGGVFRQPVASSRRDLERLAGAERADAPALYRFQTIATQGQVVGIQYPYESLLPVTPRTLAARSMRLAVMAAFFRTQAYLVDTLQLCLSDAEATRQFMVTTQGQPRYVDYGTTIIPTDDFRALEDHWEILAVVDLLFSVFEPEKAHLLSGVQVGQAIHHADTLGDAARGHGFVREILKQLDSGNLNVFLDADFYRHLSRRLPTTVGVLPRVVGAVSAVRRRYYRPSDTYPPRAD